MGDLGVNKGNFVLIEQNKRSGVTFDMNIM